MSSTANINEVVTIAKPHTIKKFELISGYVDEWARILLGYENSKGIVFIDCMCNCGIYYNVNNEIVEGTAVRVVRILKEIINNYPGKKAIIYFNDLNNARIEKLKEILDNIHYENLEIHFSTKDANKFLKDLNIKQYSYFNTLLVYDPYDAAIEWDAITPYLNIWGEVIINHMISDTTRGAHMANKDAVINKYQATYQKSIEEIIELGCDRKKLDQIIVNIIKQQTSDSNREHFIASFPFFNRTNGQVYNLIHCCSNIRGIVLYKKVAWKTFGGKSSLKNTHGMENQMCLFLGNEISIQTPTDESCFYVKDIAKYIFKKYGNNNTVSLDIIYNDLDRHPIFPSDGFKMDIKNELKSNYNVTFPRGKNAAVFRNEVN